MASNDIEPRDDVMNMIESHINTLDKNRGMCEFLHEVLEDIQNTHDYGDLYSTLFLFLKLTFGCSDSELFPTLYNQIFVKEKLMSWDDLSLLNSNPSYYRDTCWLISNLEFLYDNYSKTYFGERTTNMGQFIEFDMFGKNLYKGVYPVNVLYRPTLKELCEVTDPKDTYIGFYQTKQWGKYEHYAFVRDDVKFGIKGKKLTILDIRENETFGDGCAHQKNMGGDLVYVPVSDIIFDDGLGADDLRIATAFPKHIVDEYNLPTL